MIPKSAFCFFREGNQWCCVRGDFINLQESSAGFGDTMGQAMANFLLVCGIFDTTYKEEFV